MDPIFYFDFISPYGYLAWKRLKQEKLIEKFDLRPTVLGKIFSQIGQTPVTQVPSKRDYLYKRALKYARDNNIKLELPFQHPFNSLYLLRLSTKALDQGNNIRLSLIDKLWDYTWSKKIDVSNPDDICAQLKKDGFDNSDELMEKTFSKDVKQEVKGNIRDAINHNVFGIPSFIVHNELYWGVDTLPEIIEVL